MAGKIILASSSPRRANILKKAKFNFEIVPSRYVEEHTQTAFSYDFIEKLAYNKALEVANRINTETIILGADTVVVLDKEILGKPQNRQGAIDMLRKLSGKTHLVVTAIVLINSKTKEYKTKSVTSEVTFENLSDEQIKYYVDNYKPFDKAGSYGIQEMPEGYIKSYTGDLENIIGLSSNTVKEMLNRFEAIRH